MSIGNQIKLAREQAGVSQRKLAGDRYTGSYICQIEAGKTRPSLKALEYIAVKLNKPISFFYTGDDVVPSEQKNKMIDALVNFGKEALIRADYEKAKKYFEEALSYNEEISSLRREASIKRGLGGAFTGLKEYDSGRSYLTQALQMFSDLNEHTETAYTLFRIAQLSLEEGNQKLGDKFLSQAENFMKEHKIEEPTLLASIWNCRGILNSDAGSLQESMEAYLKALKFSEDATNLQKMGEIYSNMSIALKDAGELDKAIDCSSKSYGIFELLDNAERKASTVLNLGIVCHEKGDTQKAKDYLLQAYDIFEQLGKQEQKAHVSTELAKLALSENKLDEAEKSAKEALALTEEYCNDIERGRVLAVLGEIETNRKNWKKAKDLYKQSIDLLEKYNMTIDLTKTLQKFAQFLLTNGETQEASTYLQEALDKISKLETQRN